MKNWWNLVGAAFVISAYPTAEHPLNSRNNFSNICNKLRILLSW